MALTTEQQAQIDATLAVIDRLNEVTKRNAAATCLARWDAAEVAEEGAASD